MTAPQPGSYETLPRGYTPVYTSPWRRLGSYLLEGLLFIVTFGVGWAIWALFTVSEGQTPAKRLLGMRVIDAQSHHAARVATMILVRGLLAAFVAGLAIMFTLGILALMPFWDPKNRTMYERVSGTVVVDC